MTALQIYLGYEIVVGLCVVRNACVKSRKNYGYIPFTLLHMKGREDYINSKERPLKQG